MTKRSWYECLLFLERKQLFYISIELYLILGEKLTGVQVSRSYFSITTRLRHRSSSGNHRVSVQNQCVAISTIFHAIVYNTKFGHTVLWVKINTPVCIWLFWALDLNHANSQICAQIKLFIRINVHMVLKVLDTIEHRRINYIMSWILSKSYSKDFTSFFS